MTQRRRKTNTRSPRCAAPDDRLRRQSALPAAAGRDDASGTIGTSPLWSPSLVRRYRKSSRPPARSRTDTYRWRNGGRDIVPGPTARSPRRTPAKRCAVDRRRGARNGQINDEEAQPMPATPLSGATPACHRRCAVELRTIAPKRGLLLFGVWRQKRAALGSAAERSSIRRSSRTLREYERWPPSASARTLTLSKSWSTKERERGRRSNAAARIDWRR